MHDKWSCKCTNNIWGICDGSFILRQSSPVGLEAYQEVKFLPVAVKLNGYPILKAKNRMMYKLEFWNV